MFYRKQHRIEELTDLATSNADTVLRAWRRIEALWKLLTPEQRERALQLKLYPTADNARYPWYP